MLRARIAAAAMVFAATIYACGPGREGPAPVDGGTNTNPCVGQTGDCDPNPDNDGGVTGGDGGTDGGIIPGQVTRTIKQLRDGTAAWGQSVKVENVVVTAVSFKRQGSAGDWQGEFWVADPADPKNGLWVEKFYTDTPKPYEPKIGDKLTLEGYYGTVKSFEDRIGYRPYVSSQFDFVKSGAKPLAITVIEENATPLEDVDTTGVTDFGNAQNGDVRPNPEFGGARVFIPGPVKITNANPGALQRLNLGEAAGSNGFEVTGGILVNNFNTYRDCDLRNHALDAGQNGEEIVFQDGISGVWDTYTHADCVDGGVPADGGSFRCNSNASGHIPGSTFEGGEGENRYTFVLWPQTCADLQGTAQPIE